MVRKLKEPPPPQIGISLRVFEIDNSALDSLGLSLANGKILSVNAIKSFDKSISDLLTNRHAKLTVQPTLVASNGQPTSFLSGGEIPIANGTSVEFKSFGTMLEAIPSVLPNGNIDLVINHQMTSVQLPANGSEIPKFATESTSSRIEIRDGDTISLLTQTPRCQTISPAIKQLLLSQAYVNLCNAISWIAFIWPFESSSPHRYRGKKVFICALCLSTLTN